MMVLTSEALAKAAQVYQGLLGIIILSISVSKVVPEFVGCFLLFTFAASDIE